MLEDDDGLELRSSTAPSSTACAGVSRGCAIGSLAVRGAASRWRSPTVTSISTTSRSRGETSGRPTTGATPASVTRSWTGSHRATRVREEDRQAVSRRIRRAMAGGVPGGGRRHGAIAAGQARQPVFEAISYEGIQLRQEDASTVGAVGDDGANPPRHRMPCRPRLMLALVQGDTARPPARCRRLPGASGTCPSTTSPTMVAVAGSSASISAKVARGSRAMASWSVT